MYPFRKKQHANRHNFFRYEKSTKTQNKKFILASLLLISGIGLGFVVGKYSYDIVTFTGLVPKASILDTASLQETYSILKENYDGTIDDKKLLDAANSAMARAVGDDYTAYMNSQEAQVFNNDLSGSVGSGIGVEMTLRSGQIVVLRVLADNPALRAGIKTGDIITAVDGKSIAGEDLSSVVSKIRGNSGTQVAVTVSREGRSIDYTMVRETINNKSVDSYVKDGVGIIRIMRFDEETGKLARDAAKSLKEKNVKAIVVDLRNNGGGYVSSAEDVAGLWLDDKIIMTERVGDEIIDTIKSGRNPILNGMKTVVLINGSSASASEILAGALQDYGAATIVGEKSFGKGSVQKLFNVANGSLLKVTIAKWYTPNGKNINAGGITPNLVIEYTEDDFNKGVDAQIDGAIKEALK